MEDKFTVQVMSLETHQEATPEGSKVPFITISKLTVANAKGRFTAKFRGTKALNLNREIKETLTEGETVSGKRLFVELTGGFKQFTNDAGRRIRYFEAEDFRLVDGPALQLARIRGEAFDILTNAEALRDAGRVGMAYKAVASYLAELGQFPLDLAAIDEADAAIENGMAEDYDPEGAAASYFARQDADEAVAAELEDGAAPAEDDGLDGDDLILSSDEDLPLDGVSVEEGIELNGGSGGDHAGHVREDEDEDHVDHRVADEDERDRQEDVSVEEDGVSEDDEVRENGGRQASSNA